MNHWADDIYGDALEEQVLPVLQVYAQASLLDVSESSDIAGCFPLAPDDATLYDHYSNGIFSRLSSACTSIRSAMQATLAHIDGHVAVAVSRRAHESLWQVFWLLNPDVGADERVRRLLVLTRADIVEAIRLFSQAENALICGKLADHLAKIESVTADAKYKASDGFDEYSDYFLPRANYPAVASPPTTNEEATGPAFLWKIMCNMTHPNMVFDLIIQTQPDYQDLMDWLQVETINSAVGCVCNISTSIMEQAQWPKDKIDTVNRAFQRSVYALAQLGETRRE